MRARHALHTGLVALALALALAGMLCGCAEVGYYGQAIGGHVQLMRAARPVPDWLADPATPAPLKARLALAQRLRSFAVTDLQLPDNASYHRYADLQRPAVVWNVVAAPADALTLQTWCFALAGCVSYRGYFDEAGAQALAQTLQAQGLEVSVYGVPAYSTLGWSNWVGGDPLLNTFIGYPEGELARMVFHELAHQVVYVADDTVFNESFATAVERLGVAQWLAQHASAEVRSAYTRREAQRQAFRALTLATRGELAALYAAQARTPQTDLAAAKAAVMEQFRQRYAALQTSWTRTAPDSPEAAQAHAYDRWVARANNASFAAQGAYDDLVPGFEALFARVDGTGPGGWGRFYAAVRELADQPRAERRRALDQLRLSTKSA